jgi:predicted ATPase/predicted Ser/Thr protein kinase
MNEGASTRIGSYEILGSLGEGGMGHIYLARDPRLGRQVALKVLGQQLTQDPEAVARFVGEARAASALNHPNIVTIYEVGEFQGQHFIAMEFVRGTTLRALLNQASGLERFTDLASQIARALVAAHAAGIVHRDIKPENIMIRDDGYVKVVDFGIARLVHVLGEPGVITTSKTGQATILGTPRYMSPEQIRGDRIDSASDIFSFGIMAYEWVARRYPFEAESVIAVLSSITSDEVLAPSRFRPGISSEVEMLILEMLQKDPARRPSAAEIIERLRRPATVETTSMPPATVTVEHERVGRTRESGEVLSAFDAVAHGRGLLLGISGEPGIGKTTVVEDTLRKIASQATLAYIARGRCSERLAGAEAYLPFLEAFDSLLHGDGRETVARVLRALAPAWYAQLSAAEGPDGGKDFTSKAGSTERLKRELLASLEELSRLRPVVLFFDDVHWADASTVDLLLYIGTRIDRLRVLILATFRPNELRRANHPFLTVMHDLQGRGVGREIAVDFLTRDETGDYLSRNFPGHRFPPELASVIQDKTEGNPLFMVDLVRDLRNRDVITETEDGWELTQAVPSIVRELPASIRSMIQRKIDALSDDDRRLLITASVQGVSIDTAVVARALERDAGDLEEQLDRLDRLHGFVRLVGDQPLPDGTPSSQYRFVHVLYQNSLYESLRPVRRAAVSGVVARALAGFYASDTAPIATELAFLYETAQDHLNAAKHFLQATQKAIDVCGYREAAVLCRHGLRSIEQMSDKAAGSRFELELQLALGLSLSATQGYAAPEVEQVMTRARDLCAQAGDPTRLFRALETLWRFYFAKGDLIRASELGEELWGIASGSSDPRLQVVALAAVGFPLTQRGHLGEGLGHLDKALAIGPANDRVKLGGVMATDNRVRALAWSSIALWLMGFADQANTRLTQMIERADAIGHPFTHAFACSIAGWCYHHRREPLALQRIAEKAQAISIEYSFGGWLPVSQILLGWVMADQGQVGEGIGQMRKSIEQFKRTGAGINLPHFFSMLAEAHVKDENFGDALAAVEEGLSFADRNDDVYWRPELLRLRGAIRLRLNAPNAEADAEAAFHEAIAAARQEEARVLELRATSSLSRLWQLQEKREAAHAALAAAYGWFTEGFESNDLRDARALLDVLAPATEP